MAKWAASPDVVIDRAIENADLGMLHATVGRMLTSARHESHGCRMFTTAIVNAGL